MTAGRLALIFLAFSVLVRPLGAMAAAANNGWFVADDRADTVIVFVHGLASSSREAWSYQGDEGRGSAYWPALVRDDPVFAGSAIFLGGYHSALDSHDYDFRDAANQLHRSLAISLEPARSAVLDKPNILFVAHSAGGIVVRHMLTRRTEDFADKAVGLVLIASPSIGARDADRLGFIASIVRSKQGRQLAFNSPFLEGLDKDFRTLVDEDRIKGLRGVELLEHHLPFGMIGRLAGIVRDSVVVDEHAAGRYFGEPIRMPGSDHISIAKPSGFHHESHRALRFFYQRRFQDVLSPSGRAMAGRPGGYAPKPSSAVGRSAARPGEASAAAMPAGTPKDPVRIDEKRSAQLCGDLVEVELTSVWKQGSGKPRDRVTVMSSALDNRKATVEIGQVLSLTADCAPRLVDTGRDARYYAVFQ